MAASKSKTTGLLPFYQRYINGVPVPSGRKILRLRKQYKILIVVVSFTAICTCVFLFLQKFQVKKAAMGSEQLVDAPHSDSDVPGNGYAFLRYDKETSIPGQYRDHHEDSYNKNITEKRQPKMEHLLEQDKINMEMHHIDNDEKLDLELLAVHKRNIQLEKEIILKQHRDEQERKKLDELEEAMKVVKDHLGYPGARGGEPSDPGVKAKRDKVKEMMLHAWHSYEKYGWGANEHRPISLQSYYGGVFGADSLGATIVDSIDTLYIMELDNEYKKARDWIALKLNFDISADLSVFETNIRFVGGLLSAYSLTGDQIFKKKVKDIADRLLPAFRTETGLPLASVNLKTGSTHNHDWVNGGASILSEVGSLHLEFDYLSMVTGDSIYKDKVMTIRNFLRDIEKPEGLYPNFINPRTGKWGQNFVSMGAQGDSFYEYLLKEWLFSNKEDTEAREMYDDAMTAVFEKMLKKSNGGLTYFAELKYGRLDHKMEHLACFSAGMIGLGAEGSDDEEKQMSIGEELAHTCHESYSRSETGLGPEAFHFEGSIEAKGISENDKLYILRPEVVESWFYLWRLTKKQKYRDWAWDMVQALEKYCRVKGGFTGIRDVYQAVPQLDDVQQSFFLAETLKYLYLIFSEDTLLPLHQWVFNTEAHPLPIRGVRPAAVH